ncbi:hypothetical protein J2W42_003016 [Rhizobium tibeticum]|nr:hypothetical protein [Rhizobium tibeticum]
MAADKHEQIRRRAYESWGEGRPEGAALRHWQQACDELDGDGADRTPQEPMSGDNRDDAALLQGAGESGDIDRPRGKSTGSRKTSKKPQSSAPAVPEVEITTAKSPPGRRSRPKDHDAMRHLDHAIQIAVAAHDGQTDKVGRPYFEDCYPASAGPSGGELDYRTDSP